MNIYHILLIISLFFFLIGSIIIFQLLLSFGKYEVGDDMSEKYRKKSIKKVSIAMTFIIVGIILGIIVVFTGT